jgi:hypothetical protein
MPLLGLIISDHIQSHSITSDHIRPYPSTSHLSRPSLFTPRPSLFTLLHSSPLRRRLRESHGAGVPTPERPFSPLGGPRPRVKWDPIHMHIRISIRSRLSSLDLPYLLLRTKPAMHLHYRLPIPKQLLYCFPSTSTSLPLSFPFPFFPFSHSVGLPAPAGHGTLKKLSRGSAF